MPTERKIANNPSLRFPTQFSISPRELWQWNFLSIPPTSNHFLRAQNVRSQQKSSTTFWPLPPWPKLFLSLFSLFSPELSFHFRTKEEQRGSKKKLFLNNAIFLNERESLSLSLPSSNSEIDYITSSRSHTCILLTTYCVESRVFNSENFFFHINFPGGKKFLFLFFPFSSVGCVTSFFPAFQCHTMTRRENEGKKNKMYGKNGYVVSSFVVSCGEGSSDDFLTRTRGLGFPRTLQESANKIYSHFKIWGNT